MTSPWDPSQNQTHDRRALCPCPARDHNCSFPMRGTCGQRAKRVMWRYEGLVSATRTVGAGHRFRHPGLDRRFGAGDPAMAGCGSEAHLECPVEVAEVGGRLRRRYGRWAGLDRRCFPAAAPIVNLLTRPTIPQRLDEVTIAHVGHVGHEASRPQEREQTLASRRRRRVAANTMVLGCELERSYGH